MNRKMIGVLLFILASSSFLLVGLLEAKHSRGFSLKDPVVGHAVAVGIGTSDGNGNLKVSRTININGTVILKQTGVCTYTVEKSGAGTATCKFSAPGVPDSDETYALVIVDKKEVDYISTTPGLAVLGVGKRQQRDSDDD
jgi:hypothetical protein